jgi:sulfate transport system ATP-binding protein
MEVADRVVVMNQGKIEQEGTPEFVYHNPVNSFVYDFLGNYNSFYGRKEKDGSYTVLPATKKNAASAIIMFARPHDMDVARQMQDKDSIPARILHINPAGPLVSIDFEDRAGNMLQAALPKEKFRELDLSRGDEIFLKPRELRVFE